MHAVPDLFTRYPWLSAAAWFIFATAIHTMPAPTPDQRWYGWAYNFLHAVGANWTLFGKKAPPAV